MSKPGPNEIPFQALEYSVTHEVTYGSNEKAWVKFGATYELRQGEDVYTAADNLAAMVHHQLNARIVQAVEAVESL